MVFRKVSTTTRLCYTDVTLIISITGLKQTAFSSQRAMTFVRRQVGAGRLLWLVARAPGEYLCVVQRHVADSHFRAQHLTAQVNPLRAVVPFGTASRTIGCAKHEALQTDSR